MFDRLRKISPGIIVAVLGMIGLLFTFVDGSGEIGSKIPLVIFFIVIMSIGILILMYPQENMSDVYGEVGKFGSGKEFS